MQYVSAFTKKSTYWTDSFLLKNDDLNSESQKLRKRNCLHFIEEWFFIYRFFYLYFIRFSFSIYRSSHSQSLRTCNFIRKRLQHKCFPMKFVKFLRIVFLQSTSSGRFSRYLSLSKVPLVLSLK